MMVGSVDVVHLGPQKSGTTWLYKCLMEHPEVACAPRDSIHYYDMFYHRGQEWYASHFADARPGQIRFDTTPSYIRSLRAPERIYRDNPDVKLALTLRHPVERAFSHFWHERKNPQRRFEFTEILRNYDFFSSWLEPGFYAEHIERYLEYFPPEQILCQRFDLLQADPTAFLAEILEYLEVATEFMPSVMKIRVNEAKAIRTPVARLRIKATRGLARVLGTEYLNTRVARWMTASREYDRGIEHEVYNALLEICVSEIERTEELLNIDLTEWKAFR